MSVFLQQILTLTFPEITMKNAEDVCLGSIALGSIVPGDYFIFILFIRYSLQVQVST